jgi:hypothetical protein
MFKTTSEHLKKENRRISMGFSVGTLCPGALVVARKGHRIYVGLPGEVRGASVGNLRKARVVSSSPIIEELANIGLGSKVTVEVVPKGEHKLPQVKAIRITERRPLAPALAAILVAEDGLEIQWVRGVKIIGSFNPDHAAILWSADPRERQECFTGSTVGVLAPEFYRNFLLRSPAIPSTQSFAAFLSSCCRQKGSTLYPIVMHEANLPILAHLKRMVDKKTPVHFQSGWQVTFNQMLDLKLGPAWPVKQSGAAWWKLTVQLSDLETSFTPNVLGDNGVLRQQDVVYGIQVRSSQMRSCHLTLPGYTAGGSLLDFINTFIASGGFLWAQPKHDR